MAQIFKSASDYVCRLGSSPSSDDVAEPGAGVFSYLSSPNSQNAVPLVASRVSLPTSAATCQLLSRRGFGASSGGEPRTRSCQ